MGKNYQPFLCAFRKGVHYFKLFRGITNLLIFLPIYPDLVLLNSTTRFLKPLMLVLVNVLWIKMGNILIRYLGINPPSLNYFNLSVAIPHKVRMESFECICIPFPTVAEVIANLIG